MSRLRQDAFVGALNLLCNVLKKKTLSVNQRHFNVCEFLSNLSTEKNKVNSISPTLYPLTRENVEELFSRLELIAWNFPSKRIVLPPHCAQWSNLAKKVSSFFFTFCAHYPLITLSHYNFLKVLAH